MKLGQFLASAAAGVPTNPRPVSWRMMHPDRVRVPTVVEVSAVLAPISEAERAEAKIAARAALRKRHPNATLDDLAGSLRDEEAYQVLALALRDADDPRVSFASVDELRNSLVLQVAMDLHREWEQYMDEEFPPLVDQATYEELVKAAEGESLSALLTRSASQPAMRRALYRFVSASGR